MVALSAIIAVGWTFSGVFGVVEEVGFVLCVLIVLCSLWMSASRMR